MGVDKTGQIIRSRLFNNPSKQVQPLNVVPSSEHVFITILHFSCTGTHQFMTVLVLMDYS